MNQTLNIFRKDARQLWPEIVASLLIVIFFSYIEPKSWDPGYPGIMVVSPAFLAPVLAVLTCISWGVVLIRLIHSERLVGLNQFWTTRPYEWPQLMAAKTLFVAVFIYLPLLLCQVYLLHQANLGVAQNFHTVFWNLLLLTAELLLPIAAIATLTTSFGQTVLALLGALVALIALVAALAASVSIAELRPPHLEPLLSAMEGVVLCGLLINQFSRRATQRSLLIFAFLPIVVSLAELTVPGSLLAVHGHIPVAGESPISIQFDPNPARTLDIPVSNDPRAQFYVRIPLLVSGITQGTSFTRYGVRITLTAADGYTWKSSWRMDGGIFAQIFSSDPMASEMQTRIPKPVYDKLRSGPVSIAEEFALTQVKDMAPVTYKISTAGDMIANLGYCALDDVTSMILCRTPSRESSYFTFQSFRRAGPCIDPTAKREPAFGSLDYRSNAPTALHVSSVVATALQLRAPGGHANATQCEGDPITFVDKVPQRDILVDMPSQTIDLSKYVGSIVTRR